MKRFFLLLFLFTLIIVGCGRSSVLITDDGIYRSELLFAHNAERAKKEFKQLQISPELMETAQSWAETMAKRGRLVHGKTFIHNKFYIGGENIAWGQSQISEVIKDWMNSSGHRRNILNEKFTHVGFGYARMSDGRPYWCVQFGGIKN